MVPRGSEHLQRNETSRATGLVPNPSFHNDSCQQLLEPAHLLFHKQGLSGRCQQDNAKNEVQDVSALQDADSSCGGITDKITNDLQHDPCRADFISWRRKLLEVFLSHYISQTEHYFRNAANRTNLRMTSNVFVRPCSHRHFSW